MFRVFDCKLLHAERKSCIKLNLLLGIIIQIRKNTSLFIDCYGLNLIIRIADLININAQLCVENFISKLNTHASTKWVKSISLSWQSKVLSIYAFMLTRYISICSQILSYIQLFILSYTINQECNISVIFDLGIT